jgi:phosphoglycolate phosphatase
MTTARPAVVFDLDGTLIDSLPDLLSALNRLLAEHGRPPLTSTDVRMMVGDGAAALVERGFTATGGMPSDIAPLVRRFLEHYEPHSADETTVWPGAMEALAGLKAEGCVLGVCTNKPYRATMEILDALRLSPLLDAVVGGDSTPYKKPDPRHLAETLKAMGAEGLPAIMVGDSPNDVNAARGAHMPVIVVSFGYTRVPVAELGADALILSFGDLRQTISRILKRRV